MNETPHSETASVEAPVEAAGDGRRTWSSPALTVFVAEDASAFYAAGSDGPIGS